MIVKKLHDVPFSDMADHKGVKKQIVLGPADGSDEIILRYFSVAIGEKSPHHSHDFPHLVRIEAGSGELVDEKGAAKPLVKGDYVFINDNEVHHLKNTGNEPFDFICIVPRRGEA